MLPYSLEYRISAYILLWTLYGTYCIGLTLKYKGLINHYEQKKKPSAATESLKGKTLKKQSNYIITQKRRN
jgi:hypothetical protein